MELSFQLALCPLDFSSGSRKSSRPKPSELTPKTSAIIAEKIIASIFHPNHVEVIEGGVETSQNLLSAALGLYFLYW
jgi:aldehyde dehydrogenase (NAD+)